MKFDIQGRINNMRLPEGNAAILYSAYEAVSNSVHSIEARFAENAPTKGKIRVTVSTDAENYISSIAVQDNGTGFTPKNIDAFDTCDSRFKEALGGKGVGRLIWFKLFEKIIIRSSYRTADGVEDIAFRFRARSENSIEKIDIHSHDMGKIGSTIYLDEIKQSETRKMRKISFLRDLSLHFFSYFISNRMPEITVEFNGEIEDLGEFIKGKVEDPITTSFQVDLDGEDQSLEMTHIYVDTKISSELRNSYLLTAHNRLVGDPISIERKFALKELPQGKAYVGVVSGAILDTKVDQERLDFKLTKAQSKSISDKIIEEAESFLSEHIKVMRKEQRNTVSTLLQEHPQLIAQVGKVDEYVNKLSPGMDEEQIGENLFTLLYRDERKITKRIAQFDELESLNDEMKASVEKTMKDVSDQAKNRLAELVVKRRQILTLAKSFLKFSSADSTAYHYEKAVHDLICPMGEFFSTEDYGAHNLWVIDDLLAYYQFFASDKQIRKFTDESDSGKEPDLVFFNPLGFRREGTNEPVAIVEFKRPGDEKTSSDPVDQVLEYIEKLRDKTVRSVDGDVVSEIGENTPFECYIVCDLTKGTRKLLQRSICSHETPDGEGYFGFAPNHKATIHVISYKKMLHDAELRNEVFFKKLGLFSTR